eukprot:s2482_g8.t1
MAMCRGSCIAGRKWRTSRSIRSHDAALLCITGLVGTQCFLEGHLWFRNSPARCTWKMSAAGTAVLTWPAGCEAMVSSDIVTVSLGSVVVFIGLLLSAMAFGRNIAGFLDSLDNIEGS